MSEKDKIYDEVCRVLTDYENRDADATDLYEMLVTIESKWEDVITAED